MSDILRMLCHAARPTCYGYGDSLGCEGCAVPKCIEDIYDAGKKAGQEESRALNEEMLAALKAGIALIHRIEPEYSGTVPDMMKAAIAKAEGGVK